MSKAIFCGARAIRLRLGILSAGLLVLLLPGCGANKAENALPVVPSTAASMQIASASFAMNGTIPPRHTCDGENLSPALEWNEPPMGTQSLLLLMEDPDAPGGTFVHWMLYNLPSTVRQLPEALPIQPTLANGGIQGKNGFGKLGYGGPCPPNGRHRYFFRLYALDVRLDLPAGSRKRDVLKAVDGHVIGSATLLGQYQRP